MCLRFDLTGELDAIRAGLAAARERADEFPPAPAAAPRRAGEAGTSPSPAGVPAVPSVPPAPAGIPAVLGR